MSKKDRTSEKTILIVKWLSIVAVIILFIFVLARFCLMVTVVDGFSMYPTLYDQEVILVNKLDYKLKQPERFDIIVFSFGPADTGQYVKRIIGLPGEIIRIDENGVIFINGDMLEEEYGNEQILEPGRARTEITLGDDEYFVLGDNRSHSEDSRYALVGNIHRSQLLGSASIRIWPISKYGIIDLYRERTRGE